MTDIRDKYAPLAARDMWERLRQMSRDGRPILFYGMGDGADKAAEVCDYYGIRVSDTFASDGFVRGQVFRGRRVLSFSEACDVYRISEDEPAAVLVCFGTSRPDVLSLVENVGNHPGVKLFVPDLPVCPPAGFPRCGLMDKRYLSEHSDLLCEARSLFADETSRTVFDEILYAKITGDYDVLTSSGRHGEAGFPAIPGIENVRGVLDLGAYTGDSARQILGTSSRLSVLICVEPDRKTFKKLCRFANETSGGTSPEILPVLAAAWDRNETVPFLTSGGRGAKFAPAGNSPDKNKVVCSVEGRKPDDIWAEYGPEYGPDLIKYDVEGAEAAALEGSRDLIRRYRPSLLVSAYHKADDFVTLPLLIKKLYDGYEIILRRAGGIPAWDINVLAFDPTR